MKERFTGVEGDKQRPRKAKTLEERAAADKKRRDFVLECRRRVEKRSRQQVRESENKVQAFMTEKFTSYVHLKHHLMNFQRENVMKQFSKETPAEELSKYNLYLGGENQTSERFQGIEDRKASSAAKEREDVSEEEEDKVEEEEAN